MAILPLCCNREREAIVDALVERILILAPIGKDAALAAEALQRDAFHACVCKDLIQLGDELTRGAGALLLAEEALLPHELPVLVDRLRHQAPWSDVPVMLLTQGRELKEALRIINAFSPIG